MGEKNSETECYSTARLNVLSVNTGGWIHKKQGVVDCWPCLISLKVNSVKVSRMYLLRSGYFIIAVVVSKPPLVDSTEIHTFIIYLIHVHVCLSTLANIFLPMALGQRLQ